MASPPLCYVSSEELATLAHGLGTIDCSKLAALLDVDQDTIGNAVKEGDRQESEVKEGDGQVLYRLLTSWRDEQEIGSDIRGCLAEKLKSEFPDESEFLLHHGQETRKDVPNCS